MLTGAIRATAEVSKRFLRGITGQGRRMFVVRRFRIMFLLLLVFAWLGMDIYAGLVVQRIPTAVVDLDGSHISRTIRSYLSTARELEIVGEPVTSPEQAEKMLIDGRVGAIVLIPSDLSSNVKKAKKGEVVIAVDGSNILTGRNAYKAIAKAAGTVGAGVQLNVVGKLGERKEHMMARVVPIAIEDHPSFNPSTNYAVYLSPVLVFFLLNVYVLLIAASMFLPGERPEGVWETLGSVVTIQVIGTALGLAFLYVLLPRQHLWPAASPAMVTTMIAAWVAADIAMAAGLMLFIPARMPALELIVVLAMLALMLSGLTWPSDMFPAPLRALASTLPFTPFARSLRMMLQESATLAQLRPQLAQLGMQASVFGSMLVLGGTARGMVQWLRRRPA